MHDGLLIGCMKDCICQLRNWGGCIYTNIWLEQHSLKITLAVVTAYVNKRPKDSYYFFFVIFVIWRQLKLKLKALCFSKLCNSISDFPDNEMKMTWKWSIEFLFWYLLHIHTFKKIAFKEPGFIYVYLANRTLNQCNIWSIIMHTWEKF